jgi:hypothetical protein
MKTFSKNPLWWQNAVAKSQGKQTDHNPGDSPALRIKLAMLEASYNKAKMMLRAKERAEL